ncbi:MAG: efflux RND transporter periplasmic adaptor subunit [Gloeomargarita sp. GMQP_bins_120]
MSKRLVWPRRGWVWWVTFLAVAGVGWWFYNRFVRVFLAISQLRPQPTLVALTRPQVETVAETSEFVARLDSRQAVTVQSQVSGRVARVLVQPGARVQAGQVLVQLDDQEQQAQVQSQQAAVANAQAAVQAAQLDVQAERATLQSLQANQQARQADVALAGQEAERFRQLFREGVISRQELDRQLNQQQVSQARLQEVQAQIRTQQAAIARAQARLIRAQADLQQAQANLARARANLAFYTIRAPFAGEVGDVPVKVGDVVNANTPLLTLADNRNLELNLDIPLERAADVRLGLLVELLDAQGQVRQRGQITFVSPTVNTQSQTVQVKANFANPQGQLRSDQFVRVRVVWREQPGVLVPVTAILRLGGKDFVFVAKPFAQSGCASVVSTSPGPPPQIKADELVAVQTPVQLGRIVGDKQEVVTGLTPNDRLVPTGILQLNHCAWIAEARQPSSPDGS